MNTLIIISIILIPIAIWLGMTEKPRMDYSEVIKSLQTELQSFNEKGESDDRQNPTIGNSGPDEK